MPSGESPSAPDAAAPRVKTGLLLIQLGTPDAPRTEEVRRYLAQFLNDPFVLDINPVGRWLLLNLIILRTRPKKSAHAYAQIWDERGSPLRYHSEDLRDGVAELLDGEGFVVELAMRYGSPSIAEKVAALKAAGCERMVALPLYPQYALSSTETALVDLHAALPGNFEPGQVDIIEPFWDHPGYIEAFAAVGRPVLDELEPDHVLFSFHGLPNRHIRKCDPTGAHCLVKPDCCDEMVEANQRCYRAQSVHTARAIAAKLGLADDAWSYAFQSRLTNDWLTPFTDEVLPELAKAGHKKVAVFCPAFVADCLETLEEIGMRADEDFRAAGGEALRLVPSLNASARWVDTVVDLTRNAVR